MIIDCHGHYTTAPKALEEWRNKQIAGIKDPASMPKVSAVSYTHLDVYKRQSQISAARLCSYFQLGVYLLHL